jgi:S1-C subfamily serine protease
MSGPKHLWSGDWERDSAAASQDRAARRVKPADPEPAVTPTPPRRPRRRAVSVPAGLRRALPVALAAVLLLAAGAYGLTALLDSSGSGASTTAGAFASGSPRPVSWLGMQVETVPPGAAVIETVRPGSSGERARLSPGDVIVAVNGRTIHGTGDIAAAIQGLPAGGPVTLQISHGSTLYGTEATLTGPPSVYP